MIKKATIVLILFTLPLIADSQTIPVIDFDKFSPMLKTTNDTVYMVNFWATWCTPCVKEMPDLLKFAKDMKDKKFRLILVSLDNPDHLDSRLKPFIERFEIKERVILLDDPDANRWIPVVNKDWSGAIPASLFFSRDARQFHEDMIDYEGIKRIVEPMLKGISLTDQKIR